MKRVVLFAAMFVLAIAAPAVAAGPSPGAPGIGDPLFPGLGNGGYDVQHYDVDVRYATALTDPVEGNVTILARATQALSPLQPRLRRTQRRRGRGQRRARELAP